MADITSRDFQELIKRQKETTDKLQTIIQQNEQGDSARERFLDNYQKLLMHEVLHLKRKSLT